MNIEWQWGRIKCQQRGANHELLLLQPKKKRENSQISAFTSSLSLVGRAEQSRWHHYPEESEATASLTVKSSGGGSSLEPYFVSRIENQTVSVGRDVILGCQVKNLGHNYKVSFEWITLWKIVCLLFRNRTRDLETYCFEGNCQQNVIGSLYALYIPRRW